jgi:hypothetical protein
MAYLSFGKPRWQIECRSVPRCLCKMPTSCMPRGGVATTTAAGIQRRSLGMPMTSSRPGYELIAGVLAIVTAFFFPSSLSVFCRSWPRHSVSRSSRSRTCVRLDLASVTSRSQNYLGFCFSYLGQTRSCESETPPAKCEGKQFASSLLTPICSDCGSGKLLPFRSSVNCHEFCGLPPMSINCREARGQS